MEITSINFICFFVLLFSFPTEYRRWSNRLTLSYKVIAGLAIIWFLAFGPRLIFYRIEDGTCSASNGLYRFYDNYLQVLVSSFLPSIAMPILSILLVRNVRDMIRRRGPPVNNLSAMVKSTNSIIHHMDTQLTRMLVLESVIAGITYFPYGIQLIYSDISHQWYKSPLRVALESVLIESIHLASYVFFASSFYVSFVSNSGFRRQLMSSFWIVPRVEHSSRTAN
jgi:hypothetical protein